MNIIIKGIHLDVSPAMDAYVRKKIQGLEKFIDEGSRVEVDLSKVGHQHKSDEAFKAQYKVSSKGEYYKSEANSEDVYSAIDLARDEVYMALSSKKDKKVTLWRRGGQKVKNVMRGIASFGRRKGGDMEMF